MRSSTVRFLGLFSVFAVVGGVAACDDDNDPTTTTPPARATKFSSALTNTNELQTPQPATGSSATATYEVVNDNQITFRIVANSAINNVTQGHIHIGMSDVNGTILVPLFTRSPVVSYTAGQEIATGTIDANSISAINSRPKITVDSLRRLMEKALVYTNVHTQTFTGGEVRGQVVPTP